MRSRSRRSPAQILLALAVSGAALTAIVVFAVTDANAEAERAETERLDALQQAAALAELEAQTAAAAVAVQEAEAAVELELLGPPVPPKYVEFADLEGMAIDDVEALVGVAELTLQVSVDGEPLAPDAYDRHRVAASTELPQFVAPGGALVIEAEAKPKPKRSKFAKKYGRGY